MALKFQKELPPIASRSGSSGPTEAHKLIAKECRANPGLWAELTDGQPTWKLSEFLPLKQLGIDVRTRSADSEEYLIMKGDKKGTRGRRTLYLVYAAYNPPAATAKAAS